MPLLLERRNGVATLTLSRPESRNAWGEDFNEGIVRHCDELAFDDEVNVLVITGDEAGAAFSAGANLKDPKVHADDSTGAFLKNLPRQRRFAGTVLSEFPKPVIAVVNGYAIGVGCILTTCCDLIIASDRAQWRLTNVALGIIPNHAGTSRLARWIGKGEAMKVALGHPLMAAEAKQLGLAQWLFPHDTLKAEATKIAEGIAALPPLAARMTKESLNRGLDMPVAEAAYYDLYRSMALKQTEDAKESHVAWREKRPPKFKGL
jgi:enoyl-CoA hydratase/carnithine racemase